jgi:hypothetical protein
LEEVRTKIQVLNEEVAATMDPIEKQQKFDQIQQADNELNTLFEAQSVAKKELHDFRPVIQTTYMKMHQVDATTDSEWNLLVDAKQRNIEKRRPNSFLQRHHSSPKNGRTKLEAFKE